jgi:Protein of unknown function (DUF3572)
MSEARKQAEMLALQALTWIAADDEVFQAFLGVTGADIAQVRGSAGDPAFLGAVLDFLTSDDTWIVGFCRTHGLAYDAPILARAHLPGGDVPHWT